MTVEQQIEQIEYAATFFVDGSYRQQALLEAAQSLAELPQSGTGEQFE